MTGNVEQIRRGDSASVSIAQQQQPAAARAGLIQSTSQRPHNLLAGAAVITAMSGAALLELSSAAGHDGTRFGGVCLVAGACVLAAASMAVVCVDLAGKLRRPAPVPGTRRALAVRRAWGYGIAVVVLALGLFMTGFLAVQGHGPTLAVVLGLAGFSAWGYGASMAMAISDYDWAAAVERWRLEQAWGPVGVGGHAAAVSYRERVGSTTVSQVPRVLVEAPMAG